MINMTIGGVTSTPLDGSLSIVDNINDRSTASFAMRTVGSYVIGQEVIITDSITTDRIFAGTIESFNYRVVRGTNTREYAINCIDFNHIADRLRIAQTYEAQTVTEIVQDIITKYLASDGISLGSVPATTPQIVEANFNYIHISDALRYLQDATQINWNIDYNKNLNLFYRADNVATGFVDVDILDLEISETRSQYRNTQWLKAGDGTTETQDLEKPTPEPDGVSKTFLVRFPLSKKPAIFINDIEIDPNDIGINGLDRDKKWYWNKNKKEIVQDDAEGLLISTDKLEITYNGLVPILCKVDNDIEIASRQSVEGGTGIYESFEKNIALSDKRAAIKYAEGLLNKYDEIPEILNLRTQSYRSAGTIININSTSYGKNEDYLIESVVISEESGQVYYEMVLLSGESFGSWVEFFRKMITSPDDFIIQENEVVIQIKTDKENRDRTGNMNIKTFNALYPSDGLYPSDTLYPNTAILTEVDLVG